jgi:hypothetical protein
MFRWIALTASVLALPVAAPAALQHGATDHDPAYASANARLARTVPTYPRARLLRAEPIGGEIGDTEFQAILRIYDLSRRTTQQAVNRFYKEKLRAGWQQRRSACFVSRSRLVVALVSRNGRRLGIVVDARGGPRCYDHVGLIGDLLELGHPR